MPRQANGTYQPPAGTTAVPGATISSTSYNSQNTDFGTEITNSLDRSGRGGMTANLNMGSNRINYLASPSIATDAANKDYVDTTTTAAVGALSATLGTAATQNTGVVANTIPFIDSLGTLQTQKPAATAGWSVLAKTVGIANDSGIEVSASNNFALVLRNSAGVVQTWLKSDGSGHLFDALPAYLCRAWVNFNGTGTVAIRAAGNVSSITDNGTGDYTVNFTTAMPDGNYSTIATAIRQGANDGPVANIHESQAPSTTAVRIKTGTPTLGLNDPSIVCVSIFR